MLLKNLYFQKSNGEHLLIQENVSNEKEALSLISEFLKRHNYNSYYTRMWYSGETAIFDVGSWSEFFKFAKPEDISEVIGIEKDFIDKEELI